MKVTKRDGVCLAIGMVATPVLLKVYRVGKKFIAGRKKAPGKKPTKKSA